MEGTLEETEGGEGRDEAREKGVTGRRAAPPQVSRSGMTGARLPPP